MPLDFGSCPNKYEHFSVFIVWSPSLNKPRTATCLAKRAGLRIKNWFCWLLQVAFRSLRDVCNSVEHMSPSSFVYNFRHSHTLQ